jgi:hypothetical protein
MCTHGRPYDIVDSSRRAAIRVSRPGLYSAVYRVLKCPLLHMRSPCCSSQFKCHCHRATALTVQCIAKHCDWVDAEDVRKVFAMALAASSETSRNRYMAPYRQQKYYTQNVNEQAPRCSSACNSGLLDTDAPLTHQLVQLRKNPAAGSLS